MNVVFDVNIVLDLLLQRKGYYRLSASLLPGDTIVWTEDGAFKPLDDILAVGDHHVVQEALSNKEDSVPFIDLVAQQHRIRTKLDKNIHKVLRHGKYIMGPEVSELEERLAAFAGVKHSIGCASGTDALAAFNSASSFGTAVRLGAIFASLRQKSPNPGNS